MKFLSRRKLKPIFGGICLFLAVYFLTRSVVRFQLNQQVDYYRNYFNKNRDNLKREFNPLEIKQIPGPVIDELYKKRQEDEIKHKKNFIDWSKFAYVNYVAQEDYLCNTLIMFKALKDEYKTKAKLVLLLAEGMVNESHGNENLLEKIKNLDKDQVIVKMVEPIYKADDYTAWKASLTKLDVFGLTEFDRIVYMDNDANLQDNLDELFFLPDYVKFAAPLNYWDLKEKDLKKAYKEVKHMKNPINANKYIEKSVNRIQNGKMIYNHLPNLPHTLYLNAENIGDDILRSRTVFSISKLFHNVKPSKVKFTSDFMVIKPDNATYQNIRDVLIPYALKTKTMYDMDVINEYMYNLKEIIYDHFSVVKSLKHNFVPEVLVLPYGRYGILTGSIKDHKQHKMLQHDILGYQYLNSKGEDASDDLETVVKNCKYVHYSDYPIGKPWHYNKKETIECKIDKNSKDMKSEQKICNIWNSVVLPYYDRNDICPQPVEASKPNQVS